MDTRYGHLLEGSQALWTFTRTRLKVLFREVRKIT